MWSNLLRSSGSGRVALAAAAVAASLSSVGVASAGLLDPVTMKPSPSAGTITKGVVITRPVTPTSSTVAPGQPTTGVPTGGGVTIPPDDSVGGGGPPTPPGTH